MTTPDETRMGEAAELAARAMFEHREITDLRGELVRCACGIHYGVQHPGNGNHSGHRAQAAINAAYPVLLAGIRDDIAQAIEAMPVGSWGFRHDNERVQRDAAAIARAYGSSES